MTKRLSRATNSWHLRVFVGAVFIGVWASGWLPTVRADSTGYVINVTWMDLTGRRVYNFANSDDALRYGLGICDKVSQETDYGSLMNQVRTDFNIDDDFHAVYLISQAVDQLCPQLLWQLRNSAAHYRTPPGITP